MDIHNLIKFYLKEPNVIIYIEYAIDFGEYYLRIETEDKGETLTEVPLGSTIPEDLKQYKLEVKDLH